MIYEAVEATEIRKKGPVNFLHRFVKRFRMSALSPFSVFVAAVLVSVTFAQLTISFVRLGCKE